MAEKGGVDSPKKILLRDIYRTCIVCGNDATARYSTLNNKVVKETLGDIVELKYFDNFKTSQNSVILEEMCLFFL